MNYFIEHSQYHKILRVSALVMTAVLLFQSGVVNETTKNLADNTGQYLAQAVGMYASVSPTEVNTLTAEVTRLETALEESELALAEAREIQVDLSSGGARPSEDATYVLSAILFIILVLIVLNYALDFVRARKIENLELS